MKVMLDGQGADELFAGYLNLLGARATGLLARGRLLTAFRVGRGVPANQSANIYRMVGSAFGRLLPDRLVRAARTAIGDSLQPTWLNWRWFEERGVEAHQRPQGRGGSALREEMLLAVETLSLPQLLRYEDRNSMTHSIESRVPFCTPALAELALSLPGEYLVADDGTAKAVLRRAVRGIVSEAVLSRQKVGFAMPERVWLGSLRPWMVECLEATSPSDVPFLRWGRLREATISRLGGRDHVASVPWRLLNVSRWVPVFSVDARN